MAMKRVLFPAAALPQTTAQLSKGENVAGRRLDFIFGDLRCVQLTLQWTAFKNKRLFNTAVQINTEERFHSNIPESGDPVVTVYVNPQSPLN